MVLPFFPSLYSKTIMDFNENSKSRPLAGITVQENAGPVLVAGDNLFAKIEIAWILAILYAVIVFMTCVRLCGTWATTIA